MPPVVAPLRALLGTAWMGCTQLTLSLYSMAPACFAESLPCRASLSAEPLVVPRGRPLVALTKFCGFAAAFLMMSLASFLRVAVAFPCPSPAVRCHSLRSV